MSRRPTAAELAAKLLALSPRQREVVMRFVDLIEEYRLRGQELPPVVIPPARLQ